MRKLAFLLPACAMLTACPPPEGVKIAGHTPATIYNYDGKFRLVPAPKRLWESPLDIAGHFMKGHPESVEGKPGFETRLIDENPNDNQLTLLITAMGYLDDSVRGEQWRIKISNAGSGWGVVTAENRFMCQRGPGAGQWVIEPCP